MKHRFSLSSEPNPLGPHEGRILAIAYALAVILGLVLPVDVQDKWPTARFLSEFMAGWNPQIEAVGQMPIAAAKSNQFLYAILWCVAPIYWLLLVRHKYRQLKYAPLQLTFRSKTELLLLMCGSSWMLLITLYLETDSDHRSWQLLFVWKLSSALAAPFIVFLPALFTLFLAATAFALLCGRVRFVKEGRLNG